jgi:hypothetical protein
MSDDRGWLMEFKANAPAKNDALHPVSPYCVQLDQANGGNWKIAQEATRLSGRTDKP